jgi:GT2 family glycosyltransferase
MVDLELSEPLRAFTLEAAENGVALIARWKGRLAGFYMMEMNPGFSVSEASLSELCAKQFGRKILSLKMETALHDQERPHCSIAAPTLSIAICTKDRPQRLARLLASLGQIRNRNPFSATQILVIDNASVDSATRDVVARFPGVDYVFEPRAGLDFARNAAVRNASGMLLAFLDDDVVIDSGWVDGLYAAWLSCPDAGGFTGLVLPYRLDTEAQIQFERRGGFGRGFEPRRFHATSADNPLHPIGAGVVGAGCNMAFDRSLLRSIGGFDEALDTGAPLPGGGDLDIFYRVLRYGRPILYEPRYAVYHEHRESIKQLRRQYWTWGLGFMAFLAKSRRHDTTLKSKQKAMVRWWLLDRLSALAGAACRLNLREIEFVAAETWGGIVGFAGEYDRSLRRVQKIRERSP